MNALQLRRKKVHHPKSFTWMMSLPPVLFLQNLNPLLFPPLKLKSLFLLMRISSMILAQVRNSCLFVTLVAHGSVVHTYMSRAKLFRNPLIDGPGTTFGWWHISHRGQNVQNGPTPFYGNCHYCRDCISRTIWDRKLTDPSKCAEWPYFGGSVIYLDT